MEQARLCPKDVNAEQAVLDLTDPFFTPPQATPPPRLAATGKQREIFVINRSDSRNLCSPPLCRSTGGEGDLLHKPTGRVPAKIHHTLSSCSFCPTDDL